MRILELTNFSSGICGVWQRVKQESIELSKKGHEVLIVSSRRIQGSNEIAPKKENFGKVKAIRLPSIKVTRGGSTIFNFAKIAREFKPDIIIVHAYRQFHATKAIQTAKKLNAKVFLVTHAPFIEKNLTRTFFETLAVKIYDKFFGPKTIHKFDKVLYITKWEVPYLENLGAKKEKLAYMPNGIPDEFFTQPKSFSNKNKILFLGRISPVKQLETVIEALSLLKDGTIFEIVGPAEKKYLRKLKEIVGEKQLENQVIFSKPIFDIKEKIEKIDSADFFVLPSKREAMPQSLIEAMAREKTVLASDNRGAKEIVQHGKNGLIFKRGNPKDLAEKILQAKKKNLGKAAKKSVKQFKWGELVKKLEGLF